MTTELRVSVNNTSGTGGTALTPVFTSFHDGSFDIYNLGEAATPGLEQLAEDGASTILTAEALAADADAQFVTVTDNGAPLAATVRTSATIEVDGASNGFISLAAMLLPSNDAFIGTATPVQLFDANGDFTGPYLRAFDGASVRDAGTEVNTERDAAFINQTAPNTGEDEGGVITVHPGFNGSAGNPGGEQIILGGTNAFGQPITSAADFTVPGAQVALVHVNVVARFNGSDGDDIYFGTDADDLVSGADGDDVLLGGAGWDVLDGDAGNDILLGGGGADDLNGGMGEDVLIGGGGPDALRGGAGNDVLRGEAGGDRLYGGTGNDVVSGGEGADVFVFGTGDGADVLLDFEAGVDQVEFRLDGVSSVGDLLSAVDLIQVGDNVVLDFGGGDLLTLRGVEVGDLTPADAIFA
ncbi:hypothetical protein JANAI62_23430 [Jannaschia pagri]|uniref:Spondin domain-containing protein n=1 Tax=Jannaschia pagri TaxID=2829797 RepID=A0ABQ4NMT2_9RHOB|nr:MULTISPECIES: spondin domain-containing protein [unclassified Jannaschia]GIT91886.1 hypothetical protein JANAI61_23440 [Jannaschia sp. AI_61]GIT95720.1 hypothetical protein JANAI62_23430 [Jannaschia sp. AI_62]